MQMYVHATPLRNPECLRRFIGVCDAGSELYCILLMMNMIQLQTIFGILPFCGGDAFDLLPQHRHRASVSFHVRVSTSNMSDTVPYHCNCDSAVFLPCTIEVDWSQQYSLSTSRQSWLWHCGYTGRQALTVSPLLFFRLGEAQVDRALTRLFTALQLPPGWDDNDSLRSE